MTRANMKKSRKRFPSLAFLLQGGEEPASMSPQSRGRVAKYVRKDAVEIIRDVGVGSLDKGWVEDMANEAEQICLREDPQQVRTFAKKVARDLSKRIRRAVRAEIVKSL